MFEQMKYNVIALAAIALTASAASGQSVLYVDATAPIGGDGQTWQTAFNDLQYAIDAIDEAGPWEVRIAQGTYVPSDLNDQNNPRSARFAVTEGLTLRGGYVGLAGADPDVRDPSLYETILSGDLDGDDGPNFQNYDDNAYHVLVFHPVSVTLDGLTVRGGNADGPPPWIDKGGGMYAGSANLQVVDTIFRENRASKGGAIHMSGTAEFTNVVFDDNVAFDAHGAAIHCKPMGAIIMDQCQVTSNYAVIAAIALFDESELEVRSSSFVGNYSSNGGGAIFAIHSGMTFVDTLFLNNESEVGGGGLSTCLSDAIFVNCQFIGNESNWYGGGVEYCDSILVVNCLFAQNSSPFGGGLARSSWSKKQGNSTQVINSTFAANGEFGAANSRSIDSIYNSVFWNNALGQISTGSTDPTISFSNIQNGWNGPGSNNIDADPLFVAPGNGDYRLSIGSPSVNAGSNALLPDDILDMDGDGDTSESIPWDLAGEMRVQGGTVDMGAYEGEFEGQGQTAQAMLDPGEGALLVPSGGSFDPLFTPAVWVENVSGAPDASFTVNQVNQPLHGDSSGYIQVNAALQTSTTMQPGELIATVMLPFELADIGGADPLDIDISWFNPDFGLWRLGVTGNSQNSPGHDGPVGDRVVVNHPKSWMGFNEPGEHGIYWDDDLQRGYVFATVDIAGDFINGGPGCMTDIAPYSGDGIVDGEDLARLLGLWNDAGAWGPADADLNGTVDGEDLQAILAMWGNCQSVSPAGPPQGLPLDLRMAATKQRREPSNWGPCGADDPCTGDLNSDRSVDGVDLAMLLGAWGPCPDGDSASCPADLNGDDQVDGADLALLLGDWS